MSVFQRVFLILSVFLIFGKIASSQDYRVDCHDQSLNRLLIELRQQYDLQFSFDDEKLSRFSVSISHNFSSVPALLDAIFRELPFSWELMGEVYVIYEKEIPEAPPEFYLSGLVIEEETGESLPFSHLSINGYQTVTDVNGAFRYTATGDSVFQVQASHLGCFVMDTVLLPGRSHRIELTPFAYDLPEVIVSHNVVERSVQMGEAPGMISLNSYIAGYLPGSGDNAVFNLLRLQPGIVAAGEQPNDLIIWGSYEGTSKVKYDGMTIWGLKNFNDNISAVNPFMSKNVAVFKGGYDVTHDDLVGGVVEIAGKTGRRDRAGVNLFLNNETINGMVETPLSERSSVVLAFRQTYYNLFEPEDIDFSDSRDLEYKIDVEPEYRFRDFNAKYSWQEDDGSLFYVSMLFGDDDFSYSARQERQQNIITQTTSEENHQYGGALFWGENFKNGDRLKLQGSWSGLNSTYGVRRYIENLRFNRMFPRVDNETVTKVDEGALKVDYQFQRKAKNVPRIGLELVRDHLNITEDSSDMERISSDFEGYRIAGFLQNKMLLSEHFELKAGIRMNHSLYTSKSYLDPRVELKYKLGQNIKLNAAWGQYHQFLVKSSLFDETDNFRYTWSLADGENIPVMNSQHWVGGVTWADNDLTISLDGYYKSVEGFTRYVRFSQSREEVYEGTGQSYGLDVFLKKDFKGHTFWTSYSVGRAEELFPYFPEQQYRRAPHDQRHELKMAALVHLFKDIHVSATYVFGTGFPLYANYLSDRFTEPDYNRLDLALVYRLSLSKIDGELGLSLLNALDHYNVKYSSFEQIPLDQLNTAYIDAEAVDFTPLVFLKMRF
ncbi:TonB-dependent receptor [Marinilabilia rubra]|uniref:TonB-dependent receptor n=1 Tax=Marinilabilia rubra TaxID=2162893 RepID=UPI0018E08544|nr:TonB-dependent receptor [Marinilabilia rubra]